MSPPIARVALAVSLALALLAGCASPPAAPAPAGPKASPSAKNALAVESFLADIAQNVAGERVKVGILVPPGVDPHGFEPTPQDIAKIAESDVLIVNGAGLEEFLDKALTNAGGSRLIVEASAGLSPRAAEDEEEDGEHGAADHAHAEGNPHFWLDPNHAIRYVENIRDGLTKADPDGAATYSENADTYIAKLKELDGWIRAEAEAIPAERRLLVTNHESFGYFADRYGFRVIGTVIPSVSTGASPSAKEMAALVDQIRETGAKAIFVETGANPQLANQIARESGVSVVTDLYTHSLTDASGPAPGYLEMMRHNVKTIVAALK